MRGDFQKLTICKPSSFTYSSFMIRHTVAFTLNHPSGSAEESAFMDEALGLTAIPGVTRFEILRQVSPKCEHTFGISMEFVDQAELDTYAAHPLHTAFVEKYWIPNVRDFQEIDYIALEAR